MKKKNENTDNKRRTKINFLNPYSPMATLIIGGIITILATGDDLPWYIKLFVNNKYILACVVLIWLAISIQYVSLNKTIVELSDDNSLLKRQLEDKDNQIEQNTAVLLNRYGELAKFNKRSRFYDVLRSFVDNHVEINSAQIYSYSSKITDECMTFKINYEEGYAYEGVELNNILQSYFSFKTETYNQFIEISSLWKTYCHTDSIQSKESLKNILYDKIEGLLTKLTTELTNIADIKSVEDIHCNYYRMAMILTSLLMKLETTDEGTEFIKILGPEQVAIENCLNNIKRTGLLGSILLEDKFSFKHLGNSSKNGRLYASFYANMYKQNYLVLFSIPPRTLKEDQLNFVLNHLVKEFIDFFSTNK